MAQHMKRIAAPRSWSMHRKDNPFISVPKGPHKMYHAISVNTFFKELLKIAKTTKEVRHIILNKEVLLNGKKIKNEKTQIGLFDVLSLPETKQAFTILLNSRARLEARELAEKESNLKLTKIVGKSYLPNKKIQLNLFGGINILVDKDTYNVGDAVVLSLPKYEIKNHIKLEKGATVFLTAGRHISEVVKVSSIDQGDVICKGEDAEFSIEKSEVFVVGKDKPVISILK